MGIRYDAHITIELDIGDAAIELCVDLECEFTKGYKQTHDDPGEDDSVEILKVSKVWEERVDDTGKKTKLVHGDPPQWMQELIIEHADQDDLIEQASERDD